jgi:hypothetical protein
MTDRSKNSAEVMSEPQQANRTRHADIVAASIRHSVDMARAPSRPVGGGWAAAAIRPALLLPSSDVGNLHARWTDIQAGFVDEPRESVEKVDALVAEVMKRVAQKFASERSTLEGQWSRGESVSTEDLRVALQHYRAFFERLLLP